MIQSPRVEKRNPPPQQAQKHEPQSRQAYKLPKAAADAIDKAGEIHGQKSRAIQIGVEILWRGLKQIAPAPEVMEPPLVGRSYKLPPRTIECIELLAKRTVMTQGRILTAVATVMAEPEPRRKG